MRKLVCENKILSSFILGAFLFSQLPAHSHAMAGGSGTGGTSGTGGGSDPFGLGPLTQQVSLLNGTLQTSNGNWATTNGQLANFNVDWQGTNAQLAQGNTNWQTTNSLFSQYMPQYNTNWQNTNLQLDAANQNWSQTNQYLHELLNPANAFAIGAATGIGFALGNTLTSLAISGLKLSIAAIYEAATHEKRDAKLLEQFKKAKEEYPKINDGIEEIEARVDSFHHVAGRIKEAGSKKVLIANLNLLIHQLETASTTIKKLSVKLDTELFLGLSQELSASKTLEKYHTAITRKLPDAPDANEELHATVEGKLLKLHTMGAEIDEYLDQALKIREHLRKLSNKSICSRLEQEVALIIEAERELQNTRIRLTDPLSQRVWEDSWKKEYQENLKIAKRAQKASEYNALFKSGTKAAKGNYDDQIESDPQLKKWMYEAWYACMAKRGSPVGHIPLIGHIFSSTVRSECWAEVSDPDSTYAIKYADYLRPLRDAKEELLDDATKRQLSVKAGDYEYPRPNPEIESAALKRYRLFFDRLKEDQTTPKTSLRLANLLEKEEKILKLCSDSGSWD